jgi:hypothetical protein
MRRDDLVCAYCAGPVSEGRCRVCRAAREQYAWQSAQLRRALWAAIAVLVAIVAALVLQVRFA